MPRISYDAQSFSLEGQRIWLVSGAMHYPRTPRGLWRRRLRAAKEAGLNCIETYVFWNVHEPRPGEFDFEGQNDLRAFIEMIGEEGMLCILRPGPYVCAEWDFGGLPAWLHRVEPDRKTGPMRLRQDSALFLEACSRYLGAVMDQVRDLQVTTTLEGKRQPQSLANAPGRPAGGFTGRSGGPIVMIQAENEWMTHNPEQAESYLREIVRYLRENGCEVPINVCNQLWQEVAGTFHTWNASAHLVTDLRQLAAVQPQAPRLVSEYWAGWFDYWGSKHADTVDAGKHLHRLAEILGAGAMPNLYMFHGGTNFGFFGGRGINNPGCYYTTSYDYDAPLLEAGGRGDKYLTTKRICTFASHFGSLFAHLNPTDHPPAIDSDRTDHPLSVLPLSGSQGRVVFLLQSEEDKPRESVDLMLSSGLSLPVPLGDERAAWVVIEANLGGVAQLNYTNLRPWAFVARRMLVLFGPAGANGLVSLDDTQYELAVPGPGEPAPLVESHDELTIVVCSTAQIDAAYLFEGGLAVGCDGLDDEGHPQPLKGWGPMTRVAPDGTLTTTTDSPTRKPAAPKLGAWTYVGLDALVEGTSEAYEKIDGPTSLEKLGCDFGYGWYKIAVGKTAKEHKVLAPHSGDRLHVFADGKRLAMLGEGPGAESDPVPMHLRGEVVVLADNLGRFNFGEHLGEQKGLLDHLFYVKPVKLPKPTTTTQPPPDPFAISGYIYNFHRGEHPPAPAFTWRIKPANRKPMILEVKGLPHKAVIMVNGQPVAVYQRWVSAGRVRLVLDPEGEPFTGGQNDLTLAFFEPLDDKFDPAQYLTLYQTSGAATSRGQWSFTPFTVPGEDAFTKMPKTLSGRPAWFGTTFNTGVDRVPMFFEPRGMSKGQLYLNGHNVGRYFVADPAGKTVPPQKRYYLPEPWLNLDKPNELLVFDEHGRRPDKAKLVFSVLGPYH